MSGVESGVESGFSSGACRPGRSVLAEQLGVEVHVSSITLAEILSGHPRDARLHAVLAGMAKDPVSPETGRRAGELLGRLRRDDTVDAIVAVSAEASSATTDPRRGPGLPILGEADEQRTSFQSTCEGRDQEEPT